MSGVHEWRSILSRSEKFEFRAILGKPYHPFERESDFLQYRDRAVILRRRDGDYARDFENTGTVIQNRARRFYGISSRTMTCQKRKSDVRLAQSPALDQAANPDRRAVAKARRIQAKAVLAIAVDRSTCNVVARVLQSSYSLVADVTNEVGLVHQLQYELGIPKIELAQPQAAGLNDRHGRMHRRGGRKSAVAP